MIGKSIAFYIEQSEFSRAEIARRLKVDRAIITRLCKPKSNPTFIMLMKLSRVLNIKVSDLVTKAEEFKNER